MSWSRRSRFAIFCLGATSIVGLVLQFYRVISLSAFTLACTLPAALVLIWICFYDWRRGTGAVLGAIAIGVVSGFAACLAYDLFRLPFVLMYASGSHFWLALPLFKVFPRFGALLLSQPIEQPGYSFAAQALGWTYHFSNALGFGIMYVAAIGDPAKRHWIWAVLMALGLEATMLWMPYASTFSIRIDSGFVFLSLSAHLIFGLTLGLCARSLARWNRSHNRFSLP